MSRTGCENSNGTKETAGKSELKAGFCYVSFYSKPFRRRLAF
jgi:hypothetical protein